MINSQILQIWLSEKPAAKRRKQGGTELKTLTPDQILSRLPISLAQLNAGNNCKKVKNEIMHLFILCTDQENLQKIFIKV